jgi:DNA-binding YbaB/EbfC family protein
MLKQAQQMQAKMQEMQAALEAMDVEGTAGGGLVTVVMNGKSELKKVTIEPSLFTDENREVVEDLIIAAHTDAKAKVEEMAKEEMAKVTGGMDLPPDMKLPF